MKILTAAGITLAVFLLLASPVRAAEEDLENALGDWPAYEGPERNVTIDAPGPDDDAHPVSGTPDDTAGPRPWNFEFTIYLWLPSLDVDGIIEGQDVEMDGSSSGSSAFKLEGAFIGRLEAWHHDFAIIFDVEMLRLGDDVKIKGSGPIGVTRESEVELQGINTFLGVAWRFTGDPVGTHPKRRGFYADLIGGVRYYSLKVAVERQEGSDLEGRETFVEPVIGLRGGYHFGRVFSLSARAEAGGFGIADLPDYDVLFLLEGRFRVTSWLDLGIGYQWKWMKFSTGSGNDEFGIKAALAGPWLAITFLF